MLTEEVESLSRAAVHKVDLCDKHFGKYFLRAVLAGFFIVVATILSNVSAAILYPTYPQLGNFLVRFCFL